nr:hypothetical protein [Deinococcus aestuarii]
MTAEDALAQLGEGRPIEDATIADEVRLRQLSEDKTSVPVLLRRCHLEGLSALLLQFSAPVVFEDCTFRTANFYAAYFLRGAEFINCTFLTEVSFECGGHNEPSVRFRLAGCTFRGFVNFFDNWFHGLVEIRECAFERGTNLLGNIGQPFAVRFEVPPIIEGNTGDLALDGG